jgi:hypothetical protein
MFGTRNLTPPYDARVGIENVMWASDGAPLFQASPVGALLCAPQPGLALPPRAIMWERPVFVKGKGWVSSAAPNG